VPCLGAGRTPLLYRAHRCRGPLVARRDAVQMREALYEFVIGLHGDSKKQAKTEVCVLSRTIIVVFCMALVEIQHPNGIESPGHERLSAHPTIPLFGHRNSLSL
jgi:hypothetical protein